REGEFVLGDGQARHRGAGAGQVRGLRGRRIDAKGKRALLRVDRERHAGRVHLYSAAHREVHFLRAQLQRLLARVVAAREAAHRGREGALAGEQVHPGRADRNRGLLAVYLVVRGVVGEVADVELEAVQGQDTAQAEIRRAEFHAGDRELILIDGQAVDRGGRVAEVRGRRPKPVGA